MYLEHIWIFLLNTSSLHSLISLFSFGWESFRSYQPSIVTTVGIFVYIPTVIVTLYMKSFYKHKHNEITIDNSEIRIIANLVSHVVVAFREIIIRGK